MGIGKSLKQLRLEIPGTTITFSETNITELKFKLVVQRLDQSLKEKLVSPKSYQEESRKREEEMDNELLLFDRLEIIKTTINKYGIDNFYLSFSGGKDSTILHHLIDMALPGNRIPRVFVNTGIEYNMIVQFVKDMAAKDDRFVIIAPSKPIKKVLEEFGYPFKSKEHSLRVYQFNKGQNSNYIKKYISGYDHNGKESTFVCPKILKYQFEERGKYNYSNLCCQKLKKEPVHKWEKENHKSIAMTGMRAEEGGNRARLGCIITDSKGRLKRFHPLIKVDEQWEDWLIERERERERIALAPLYCQPFNFKRTGCKGCPFSLELQEQLDIMQIYLPAERKQCEFIWEYVYKEYRRIGYRLKDKITIWD